MSVTKNIKIISMGVYLPKKSFQSIRISISP